MTSFILIYSLGDSRCAIDDETSLEARWDESTLGSLFCGGGSDLWHGGLDVLQLEAIFEISEFGWLFCMPSLDSVEGLSENAVWMFTVENVLVGLLVGNGDWE